MSKEREMDDIGKLIRNCKKCDLYKTKINVVVGEGSLDSHIMFIGEAPGANEDKQGRPFVGKAGKILDELLESINLKRGDVFIANILKCRPPRNRNPLQSEIRSCTNFLDNQIKCIHPIMIVPMGNFASSYIFEKFDLKYDKISKIHGRTHRISTIFGDITIIPIYHPAAATYNPGMKDTLLSDFKVIKRSLKNVEVFS
jgi:DNA polymerase